MRFIFENCLERLAKNWNGICVSALLHAVNSNVVHIGNRLRWCHHIGGGEFVLVEVKLCETKTRCENTSKSAKFSVAGLKEGFRTENSLSRVDKVSKKTQNPQLLLAYVVCPVCWRSRGILWKKEVN